jgi:hypothetical protein
MSKAGLPGFSCKKCITWILLANNALPLGATPQSLLHGTGLTLTAAARQAVSDVELKGGQPRVDATAIHEFGVGALLHQPAMVQY